MTMLTRSDAATLDRPAATDQPLVARLDQLPCDRTATLTREAVNVEARTVELAFASEAPYMRWWGIETLSMERTAVRLGRLSSGQHPLLVNHCPDDQVGVVERAWVDADRKARAIVRFGRSAQAQEIFQDVQDGIRSLVSVGYRIHDAKLVRTNDAGDDEYLVTDWEPYEVSIVAIPADPTVGVGRSLDRHAVRGLITQTTPQSQPRRKERSMDEDEVLTENDKKPAPKTPALPAEAKRAREDGMAHERQRIRDITALGSKFGKRAEAEKAVEDGTPYDTFREAVFGGLEKSGALKLAEPGEIGLSKREVQQFRFTNLIAASMWPDDPTVRKMAAFEMDAARAAADKRDDVRKDRDGAFTIPVDVLAGALDMRSTDAEQATKLLLQRAMAGGRLGQQRDLVVGTPSAGGNLVSTDLLASSFIDILVNQLSVMQMGATMLTGLSGNVAIPRATGGSTGYWVAENGAPTESAPAFDQVALTPKTVGAFVDYSRRLLLQSSIAVEAFVRMDIARTIALMIDLGALTGTGASNQPRGLLNTAGIGSVVGGTNGAAPTWDNIVDLESAVANANAPTGALGYLTNTKVRGKLKKTQQFSGTNGQAIWTGAELNGAPARVSNQIPSNLTKGTSAGVCSAITYGNWSDLIIAMWGGLDIMLDPYAGSTAGTRRVVALQDVDCNVRYAISFAAMLDALTT
jgi:HK97 family phage major capsid protein